MGKKLEKKIITVTVDANFIEYLEGPVDKVIGRLQTIKKDYSKRTLVPWDGSIKEEIIPEIAACEWFSLDYDRGYYSEEPASITLLGHRYETDEEFEARKKKRNATNAKKRAEAKKKKADAEEAEKELYTKLQKKYG